MDDSNPEKVKCLRYRDAEGVTNKIYSVLFMLFGKLHFNSRIHKNLEQFYKSTRKQVKPENIVCY